MNGREIMTCQIRHLKTKTMKQYFRPETSVRRAEVREMLLAGSGIGGQNNGEDFPFGARERIKNISVNNNID